MLAVVTSGTKSLLRNIFRGRAEQATVDAGIRSRERYRRAALTALSGFGSKAVTMLTNLALVPLMLGHLGDMQYGIWLTLQTMLSFLAFADFGIGNGALNAIATANAKQDRNAVNRALASAIWMLILLAILIAASLAAGWRWLPWSTLLGTTDPVLLGSISAGLAVFAAGFAATLPLSFVERLSSAFQEGAVANVARSVASLITLCATWAVASRGGGFEVVTAAMMLPSLLCWAAAWIYRFRERPWLSASIRLADAGMAIDLLRIGALFVGLQICATLGFALDNLFITANLGPGAVASYAVPHRLFSVIVVLVGIVLAPLWPAYADAKASGDEGWIRRTLFRSLGITVAVSLISAASLSLVMPWLLHLWVGDRVTTTTTLTVGLAALTVVQCIGMTLAMFWNGTSQIRLQLLLGALFVVFATPIKVNLLRSSGVQTLPLAVAGVYVVCVLVPAVILMWPRTRAAIHPGA